MRVLLFVAAGLVLTPKFLNVSDIDREAVRHEVRAWTAEHRTEIQAVVREVMLSRSQVGALAAAAIEATDAARESRRSYWQ